MSETGAQRDYDYAQKNHWRRTLWNEVLKRTDGREKHEIVLYLPGPQDNDRDVATSKGVPHRNLIAIDRCQKNVDAIRARGYSAICADALDVLWSWPDDKKVCAVVLDFCCGIERDNASVYDAMERRGLRSAVAAINLQRGRDGVSQRSRQALSDIGLLSGWMDNGRMTASAKHRGLAFLVMHCMHYFLLVSAKMGLDLNGLTVGETHSYVSGLVGMHRPAFTSYKSGRLVFDSVVYDRERLSDARRRHGIEDAHDAEIGEFARRYTEKDITRKLAAMFAVRTKRAV